MSPADDKTVENLPVILRWLSTRKSRRITLAIVTSVILLAGGVWYWYGQSSVVSRQIVSEADFTVYAPKQAPSGYQTQQDQVRLGGNILSYGFSNPSSDKDITVTVQPRPAGFDVAQLTKGGSINSVVTDNGTLYNLSIGGASQYLLDTGDSLVYLTSPSSVDTATINQLANSLQKLN